ncbi:MAG: MaoC family dehydratase [Pseudomonadales bacterium]|nr:MaoC family dehydratase [Pseudomonadales bacterium]
MSEDSFRQRAILAKKGHKFEDFEEGQIYEHHWGRTITDADNSWFSTQTLSFNPLYFNEPYAQSLGHKKMVVNPLLVFNTAFGMSVEDLSEGGGLFLGVDGCEFKEAVHVGDTLTARSTVVSKRISKSNKQAGIVSWFTEGFNQNGTKVVEFTRTNFVRFGNPSAIVMGDA